LCSESARGVGMAHLRDDRRWRLEARVTGAGYGGGEVRAGAVMRHRGVRSLLLGGAPVVVAMKGSRHDDNDGGERVPTQRHDRVSAAVTAAITGSQWWQHALQSLP
jgi:hypothetical protein